VKIPKGMEMPFADATDGTEHEMRGVIDRYAADQTVKLEQELFKQRKRLADALRSLQTKVNQGRLRKPTHCHQQDRRDHRAAVGFASRRVTGSRLSSLSRSLRAGDGHGERQARDKAHALPVRAGWQPAFHDVKFPGTYNARRDNLEGFWKGLFGYSHGLVVVNAFYENVNRHHTEGRELRKGEPVENVFVADTDFQIADTTSGAIVRTRTRSRARVVGLSLVFLWFFIGGIAHFAATETKCGSCRRTSRGLARRCWSAVSSS
jgi:hypothetical protein